ncbi:MAG: hypothetical protein ABR923_13160 [Terracidiphilus sp.]
MKQTRTSPSETTNAEIDRILATEEPLLPSSGFLMSVMERVREEAAAPAPIPFPWKRALPGMVVVACILGAGAFEILRRALPVAGEFTLAAPQISAAMERSMEQAGWVALAMGASLFSWMLAKRLAGRSGLL